MTGKDNIEFEQIYKKKDYKPELRKETQHFIIYCTETDTTCIDKVLEVLEKNYKRITTNLNQQLQEKLTIEIHSDRDWPSRGY